MAAPGRGRSARDRPSSVGHLVGGDATPGVPPGSWRIEVPKRADGRAVPQLGPPGEASGEREFQKEAVGWDGGCEPRPFVGSRRGGGSASRTTGKQITHEDTTMKKYLVIVLVALVSFGLGANGFAQETKGAATGAPGSTPAAGPRMNAFLVDRIIGSKVMNLQGDTLVLWFISSATYSATPPGPGRAAGDRASSGDLSGPTA